MVTALAGRLRRVTNGRPWIPEIDGLRFIAIVSVVLFHIAGELSKRSGRVVNVEPRYWWLDLIIGNGDRGVRLFFVISGLVLALPFARQWLAEGRPVSVRAYYMRRVTRLEPPYIAATLLFVLLFSVYTHAFTWDYAKHVIASLLYLHGPVYGYGTPVNVVGWSLEVEVQFYLLAPLFMQIFRVGSRLYRRTLLLLCAIVTAPWQDLILHTGWANVSVLRYSGYFFVGLLLADIFVTELPRWSEGVWWDLLAMGALAVIYTLGHDWAPAHLLLPFVCGALCLAAMRGPIVRRLLSTPWIAITGGMCYSIYLLHFQMIAVFFKWTRRLIQPGFDFVGNYVVQCAVLIPLIMTVSIAFYMLIERPCMDPQWPAKLKRRLLGRPEPAAMLTPRS